jgi:ribosomal-protein-alanine N-acetyltransferase
MDAGSSYSIARLSGDADIEDVAALEASSFTTPWPRDMLARELQNTSVSRIYVMRDHAGTLIGFCACWLLADELHINTLAVQRSERRRGHATNLLRFVFREAVAEGACRATLEVRRSNDGALKLYERLGFSVRGVRRNYYDRPPEDALILWSERLESPTEPCP